MPRWVINISICVYMLALASGVGSYLLKFGQAYHPVQYYFTWDMFCGWSSWETRYHVLGEGDSGTYYQLSPGPWGEFAPFGDLTRNHYDPLGNALPRMALNVLRQTEHEPIRRIVVVEEMWAKKYNLPDRLWNERFTEPKAPHSYFWVKAAFGPEGELLERRGEWLSHLYGQSVMDNPRLVADSKRGQPFYALDNAPLQASAWPGSRPDLGFAATRTKP